MENYHPSYDIIGTKSNILKGKRIVLGITGSVAAIRAPDIARILMRHAAHIYPVMTKASLQIIHPDVMYWATGNKPVLEITGALEHIALAGKVKTKADLILIAPATANTISKIACAIDDTAVTSVATTALGQGLPLVIAPAMHESMYQHPLLKQNIEKLREIGVIFLLPHLQEGKAKLAASEEIANIIIQCLTKKKTLKNKKVLITSGRTIEYLDPIRVVTNKSTGKMGMCLAHNALYRGAEVTVIYGKGEAPIPEGVKLIGVETALEMSNAVFRELKTNSYNIVICAAAVGDWRPKKKSKAKLSTHKQKILNLELEATPKIIDRVKKIVPATFLVAFRALYAVKKQELIQDAYKHLQKAKADLIVVNDVSTPGAGFESDSNEVFIITPEKKVTHLPLEAKQTLAAKIWDIISEHIKKL